MVLFFLFVIFPLLTYILQKRLQISHVTAYCVISDNNRKKLDRNWNEYILQFKKIRWKLIKNFRIHYPIFTFSFNWIRLNGFCFLGLTRQNQSTRTISRYAEIDLVKIFQNLQGEVHLRYFLRLLDSAFIKNGFFKQKSVGVFVQ